MEALLSTPIMVPLSQIVFALIPSTIALLFGRVRVALFVIYCFVLYWGKPWNIPIFTETIPPKLNGTEVVFVAFCFLTVFLAMMGFALHRD